MRRALPVLGLALAACDPETTCEQAADTPAALTVGLGEISFSPAPEGVTLDREYGSQGGQHVWVALRATGLAPGRQSLLADDTAPRTVVRIVDAGTEVVYAQVNHHLPWDGTEAEAEVVGLRAVLDWVVTESDDRGPLPVILSAEVTDECGTALTDAVDAVL